MLMLDVHEYFASLSPQERKEIFPGDFQMRLRGGMADVWPAAATAAVIIGTGLSTMDSESDLKEALGHFQHLVSAGGIIDEEAWQQETLTVLQELCEAGWDSDNALPVPSPN